MTLIGDLDEGTCRAQKEMCPLVELVLYGF